MTRDYKKVDDIETPPGPVTFTMEHSQNGYRLNGICYSLKQEKNRKKFRQDHEKYMDDFGLSEFEKELVRSHDWLKMVHYGVSPYVIGKMAQCFDLSFIDWGAYMRGEPPQEFIDRTVPLLKNYNPGEE
jgi:protocatechuate 4,5-dioxygenase, alpha chain|tara:strand:+ start:13235 stop:13621 length:387 start_codon:yes stop_codon:yes gene_type:complete